MNFGIKIIEYYKYLAIIKLNWLSRPSFLSDALKLAGSTAIAQALGILASPLITRIYSPEAFGLSALFVSITSIIAVVACLRYECTIMLPEKDKDAANLLALSLLLVIATSCMSALVFWFGGSTLLILMNKQELGKYLWLVPISLFLSGVFASLNYWNSRTKQFGRLSIARLTASFTIIGTQLGAGFSGHATGGSLIGAGLLGSAVSTLMLGRQIWQDNGHLLKKSVNLLDMIVALKRYKNFPLLDTWGSLLNGISWQLPAIVLSVFFSSEVVGYYALSMMVIQLPMSLIGASIAQVFFQRASRASFDGNIAPVVEGLFRILLVLGLFPMLMLSILGKDLFVMFFGSAWSEAGIYVQMISIWSIFWFISSPLSSLFAVLEELGFGLKLDIFIFCTRILSLCIGGWFDNARISIALFAISGIFAYGYYCYAIMVYSGVPRINIVRFFTYNLIMFIPAGISLIALKIIGVTVQIQILISFILLAIYYCYVVKRDPQMKNILAILS
jgi:lipopolysaccharide exporter